MRGKEEVCAVSNFCEMLDFCLMDVFSVADFCETSGAFSVLRFSRSSFIKSVFSVRQGHPKNWQP